MSREQKRSLLLIAAAAVLLIGLHFVPVTGWLKLVLYLIPYLLVGGETLVDACKGIYNRQPFDENLLMAVATIGAMVLGDYPEAVSVMLFYQIGELFESYAVGRSRKNIGDLMDIRPDYANVETADGVTRVKPEQVAVGDTIVVKPGERVPLDGTVLTGTSALNMSALTGESAPVDVTEGSAVVSGSVNLSGVLRLRVEKVYAESTVARILELVENSSLKKAHTERFITKFARVYTPSVCGAALALQREYEFQAAACMDKFMHKTDLRVTKMMLKGYEQDKAANAPQPKYRCLVWACPAHYYTNFTYWTQHCWGVTCVNDMEAMLSYQPITIGDKEQALADLVRCYEKMMMRSHTNGGYVNLLDECWKMCEKFHTNIVIMYDHVSCKNVGGLHGLFEDQARERGIHLIWIPHDVMDPRTVSRREMREAFSQYMVTVLNEKPLDPTLLDYEDALSW